MDYSLLYARLIDKFRSEKPDGYTESHHIIPRCIGGEDAPDNLVRLPARYHFVAHLLLAKIHGGKLIHAAWMMSNEGRFNSKKYVWLRQLHSDAVSKSQKGRKLSPDTKAKIVATRRKNGGYVVTPEMKAALSKAHKGNAYAKGNKLSQQMRDQISQRQTGQKRPEVSRKQQGAGNNFYGKSHTLQSIEKMRAAQLGKKHPYKKRRPLTAEERRRKSDEYKKRGIKRPKIFGNTFNKGKIWVSNVELGVNALIRPDEMEIYLGNGYRAGRGKIKSRAKVA